MPLNRVRLRRRLSLPREVAKDLFIRSSRVLIVVGRCDPSTCAASIRSKPDYEFTFDSLDDWKTFVGDRWTEIARTRLSAWSNGKAVSVDYDVVNGEAGLHLEAPTVEMIDAMAAEAEKILELPRLLDGEGKGLHGLRRKYFINEEVTPTWIKALVGAIRRDVGPSLYISARLRWAQPAASEQAFEDLDAWLAELAANWNHLGSVYLWLSSSSRRMLFDCDIRRQLLVLESYAHSYQEAAARLSSLASMLDLEEAPDDPFKYRRFAKVFKIVHWKTNSAFARAVELALAKGFATSPALVESYTATGRGAEDLEPIHSIDTFVARVGEPGASIDRAHLYVEGARGRGLGITLDRTKEELWIGSSLDRKEFNAVVECFENAVDLKLKKEEAPPKDDVPRKPSGEGLLAKLIVAVVGLFLSVEVIKESIPRYSVEITFPRTQSDGKAAVVSGELALDWVVRRSRWWDNAELTPPMEAMLTILDSRGSPISPGAARIGSGFQLQLGPGHYEVILRFPELGKSARLPLVVSASP